MTQLKLCCYNLFFSIRFPKFHELTMENLFTYKELMTYTLCTYILCTVRNVPKLLTMYYCITKMNKLIQKTKGERFAKTIMMDEQLFLLLLPKGLGWLCMRKYEYQYGLSSLTTLLCRSVFGTNFLNLI